MTVSDDSTDGSDGELARGELVAGRYRIERVLGRGATGIVYAAEHQWTRRRVALKVLRAAFAQNERVVARFLREARVCAELSHRSLVAVLDMGQDEHDGLLFLAQELVEGETLRALLEARRTLSEAETLGIIEDIAAALDVVHGAGLVHRDVKPENIIVCPPSDTPGPRAKLIDFGIARELDRDAHGSQTRTQLGAVIGTPRYMSPEQARATGAIDARSDQYALAVVAYECLTGRTPHEGESAPLLLAHLLTQPPMPITRADVPISDAVARAVMRALATDRAERFGSTRAFAAALRAPSVRRPSRAPAVIASVALAAIGATALQGRASRQRAPESRALDSGQRAYDAPRDAMDAHDAPAADVRQVLAADDSASPPTRARARTASATAARNARAASATDPRDAETIAAHDEPDVLVVASRSWLRPVTFHDGGSWLRPASVR